jgi:hypothetical protein
VLGMYCFQPWVSVSFCLYLLSDFSKTRPHITISFCRHLEHCQVCRLHFSAVGSLI